MERCVLNYFSKICMLVFLFFFNFFELNAELKSSKTLLPTDSHGKVYLTVSVDWEGRDITWKNLEAMKKFRMENSDVPLLHFLNAAYFTKKHINRDHTVKKIRSVMKSFDEHGLHIHSWKSLVKTSGVTYRHYPKWIPRIYHQDAVRKCKTQDCGHEVPISAYSKEDIRKIIKKSKSILGLYGFNHPISFRAGGWMANESVYTALKEEGFRFDSSPLPTIHLKGKLVGYHIHEWLDHLWADITPSSQPFAYYESEKQLISMPDNGCLADYMMAEDMVKVFKTNIDVWKKKPENSVYVHIGFHQETAFKYSKRVTRALQKIRKYSAQENIPLEIVTFSDLLNSYTLLN